MVGKNILNIFFIFISCCSFLNIGSFAYCKVLTTFGDSNTAHNIYQPKLQKLLPEYIITNRGQSGDTTRDGLHRVDSVLLQDYPDILFIMFGTNNTTFPFIVYDDITEIVQRAKQFSNCQILVATVGYTGVADRDQNIPIINNALKRVVDEQDVILVDVFESLEKTGENYLREPKHYNDFGHKVIAETIYKALHSSVVNRETVAAQGAINMILLR